MTAEDLQRIERELEPLVPLETASAFAREDARRFNAEVSDVRGAILEPLRGLLATGDVRPELSSCLERVVAELAFWRRVLAKVHANAFAPASGNPDFLVSYLRS